jgi:hypothetical protein
VISAYAVQVVCFVGFPLLIHSIKQFPANINEINKLIPGVKIPAMSLGIDALAVIRFGDHEKTSTISAVTKQEMYALIGCVLPGPEVVEGWSQKTLLRGASAIGLTLNCLVNLAIP